jgi:C4-dicarboxylate-specific signal transduction histidine kinase
VAAAWRDLPDEKTTALQFLMISLVATGLLVSGQVEIRLRAEAALRERLGELARLGRIHSTAEIATGLVHELKQPMLAILNYVGAAIRLLERRPPAVEEAQDILRKADLQVDRADAILRRMRSYVQKGEPHISSVMVGDAFREAVDLITPLARRHAVVVSVEPFSDLPPLLADPIQVLQVLVNLLSNAVHAIADHDCRERQVVVAARRLSSNRVEIAVSDSGPGLADDVIPELYQPFVTTRPEGVGLGLAISRSIAEAHGGTLVHDRPQPEGGATFRLILPCAEVSDAG